MIYDCFTFFNELDLLEIRLNVLNPYVDKFVIVEATRTQNNKDKVSYYELNKERYKAFEDKIIHVVLDKYPETIDQWTIENLQRNYIMQGLKDCNDDDVIIISDLDEIPNPKLIKKHYKKGRITAFDLNCFNYFLNNYTQGQKWTHGPKILSYCDLKTILSKDRKLELNRYGIDPNVNEINTPCMVRLYYGPLQKHIKNAGWHFSNIGKKECMEKKVSACESKFKVMTEEDYKKMSTKTKFGQSDLVPVKLNAFFPDYLVKNKVLYEHLLLEGRLRNIYSTRLIGYIKHLRNKVINKMIKK